MSSRSTTRGRRVRNPRRPADGIDAQLLRITRAVDLLSCVRFVALHADSPAAPDINAGDAMTIPIEIITNATEQIERETIKMHQQQRAGK